MIRRGSMVRIHPDPPGNKAGGGAVAQLGEHLLCKQGVVGSIPISSTTSGNRGQATGNRRPWPPIDCVTAAFKRGDCEAVIRVESCGCSLTIREGKAHSRLMRSWMRRVELYLAWARARQKARESGWRKHARSGVSFRRKGPRLWGQATKCM